MKRAVEETLSWDINELISKGVFRAPAGTPCGCSWSDADGKELLRVDFHVKRDRSGQYLRLFEHGCGRHPSPGGKKIEIASVPCHFGGRGICSDVLAVMH